MISLISEGHSGLCGEAALLVVSGAGVRTCVLLLLCCAPLCPLWPFSTTCSTGNLLRRTQASGLVLFESWQCHFPDYLLFGKKDKFCNLKKKQTTFLGWRCHSSDYLLSSVMMTNWQFSIRRGSWHRPFQGGNKRKPVFQWAPSDWRLMNCWLIGTMNKILRTRDVRSWGEKRTSQG